MVGPKPVAPRQNPVEPLGGQPADGGTFGYHVVGQQAITARPAGFCFSKRITMALTLADTGHLRPFVAKDENETDPRPRPMIAAGHQVSQIRTERGNDERIRDCSRTEIVLPSKSSPQLVSKRDRGRARESLRFGGF